MSSQVFEQAVEPFPNKKLPPKSNNGRGTSVPVAIGDALKMHSSS